MIQTIDRMRLVPGDIITTYGAVGRVVTVRHYEPQPGESRPCAVNMVRMLAIPADSTFASLGDRAGFLSGRRLWNEQGNSLATSYVVLDDPTPRA